GLEQDRPRLMARGDVEKHQFVGALLVVLARDLDRVAGVLHVLEADALDHAAAVDVEAGDDAFGEHGRGETREGRRRNRGTARSLRLPSHEVAIFIASWKSSEPW